MLFNEIDMLELRLNELWDAVDRFVVVEAAFTHAGAAKPLLFNEHAARFAPYRDKIVYHALHRLPAPNVRSERERLGIEIFQRDAIGTALAALRPSGSDIVIVSDVDEIPRARTVASLDGRLDEAGFCIFVQRHYHRYINYAWAGTGQPPQWLGSVACRYRTLRRIGAHQVRRGGNRAGILLEQKDRRWPHVDDGGWHFTWMGGAEASWVKAQHIHHILEKASGLRTIGPEMPIQVFPSALAREACREIQARYLAEAESPAFAPLDFDEFAIAQDVPEYLARNRERFRRYFFFTSGL
ncbi:MAG: hypothetical protein JNL66_23510 [Alphaproteobacteria bacterium]|nr:hypothetical protein [Alphaproteobacteria bacterium]